MKKGKYRRRRLAAVLSALVAVVAVVVANPASYEQIFHRADGADSLAGGEDAAADARADALGATAGAGSAADAAGGSAAGAVDGAAGGASSASGDALGTALGSRTVTALQLLDQLSIKGRAPKTGYTREEFYKTWPTVDGCNLRQRILRRELGDSAQLDSDNCTVISGAFVEPYTGQYLVYSQKSDLTSGLQIDHVVALSDAWQKGAQNFDADTRYEFATDPLNLIAVDSSANQKKSDGDAATWLPPNKAFRCQYVARQVSVKYKYDLWVTQAEYDAIAKILATCPDEPAVGVQ